jgi:hypothetical protein
MAETLMQNVLQKPGLKHAYVHFEREKITPDIVSLLSSHELEAIGISDSSLKSSCFSRPNTKRIHPMNRISKSPSLYSNTLDNQHLSQHILTHRGKSLTISPNKLSTSSSFICENVCLLRPNCAILR